ncbi:MAG TPA: cytochrome c [Gemmataceae bacterium]|nr:cytochrome c [Gemmataceae bacterium]
MIARRPSGRNFFRVLLITLPTALACLLLAGCEDGYDVDILYPPRADWLVVESLKDVVPTRYDPPGMLPLETLDHLDSTLFGPDQKLLLPKKGGAILDPRILPSDTRRELALALRDLAGRPAHPKIDISGDKFFWEDKGARSQIDLVLEKELKLDSKTLEQGSALYRTNCLHCHGLAGDGRGPTGHWINPHPRDYRQGIFKFTSSAQTTNRKPRRDDLKRVLVNGIEGTTMPSFHLLKPDELEALVSYIIHLSIRGEAEYAVLQDLIRDTQQAAPAGDPMIERIRAKADEIARSWLEAQKTQIKPPVNPPEYKSEEERLASAARGYKVYANKDVACAGCHLNYGRDAAFRYDAWGTIVKPRNFFQNMYRGGRRPIEVYWRIAGGINGADMAPFAKNPAAITEEEDKQIWDLINFLNILPYPEKRQELKDKHGITVE